jgi:hypothetical protein
MRAANGPLRRPPINLRSVDDAGRQRPAEETANQAASG